MNYYLFTALFVSTKKNKKNKNKKQGRAAFTNSSNYEQALIGNYYFIYSVIYIQKK